MTHELDLTTYDLTTFDLWPAMLLAFFTCVRYQLLVWDASSYHRNVLRLAPIWVNIIERKTQGIHPRRRHGLLIYEMS